MEGLAMEGLALEGLAVTRTRLMHWGPSPDCPGCLVVALRRRARDEHTAECVTRFLRLGTAHKEREMQVAKGNKMFPPDI